MYCLNSSEMELYKVIFYLGLSFFTMHEMDAVRCKEWRIFPGLTSLDDKWGFLIFMLAHIPIFFFINISLVNTDSPDKFMVGFNIFLILHMAIHIIYIKHKKNEFKDWISWTLIIGAGLSGAASLAFNIV